MSFITRAFTPPGTGGADAQVAIAQGAAMQAAAQAAPLPTPPTPPVPPAAPAAAPAFGPTPTQVASAQRRTGVGATTFLGSAATAAQMAGPKATGGTLGA